MSGRLLAIVMGVIILLGAAYATLTIRREKEGHFARAAALKNTLLTMREAIDRFHTDQQHYPRTLQELVPRYIARVPSDPVTGLSDWHLETEQHVTPNSDFMTTTAKGETYVIDVHSSASGLDANGVPFASY